MQKGDKVSAIPVRTMNGFLTDDGKFAILKIVQNTTAPEGEAEVHFAIPVQGLPSVLSLMLQLMEPGHYPEGDEGQRGCFYVKDIDVGSIPDGRQALTFDLSIGGRMTFVLDDQQARMIVGTMGQWLADKEGASPASTQH